jgi:uncharacterized membrane protein YeaQ/YmgE (transglycosylase-associated protein family)
LRHRQVLHVVQKGGAEEVHGDGSVANTVSAPDDLQVADWLTKTSDRWARKRIALISSVNLARQDLLTFVVLFDDIHENLDPRLPRATGTDLVDTPAEAEQHHQGGWSGTGSSLDLATEALVDLVNGGLRGLIGGCPAQAFQPTGRQGVKHGRLLFQLERNQGEEERNQHGAEPNADIVKTMLSQLHAKGQGTGPKEEVGDVLYMRGVIGAMLGGWLISPLLGVGTINQSNFSIGSMVVSLVGAVILLAVVNLFRRGSVR